MRKEEFENKLTDYLLCHGWNRLVKENKVSFVHGNEKGFLDTPLTRYYSVKKISSAIKSVFLKKQLTEFHYDSVINPYPDSDFIIAALQYINRYIFGEYTPNKELIYSFQPVIRKIPMGGLIKDGFLRSFINVGTVGICQNIDDYFEQLEIWIDVFSACHIHISRLGIKVKQETNVYNGVGIEITVDGREVGQSNYYEIDCKGKWMGVTDMGFGLEHICWASNKWHGFETTFQSPLSYYLGYDNVSDLVNIIVLLIVSGVRPGANGFSAELRKYIKELSEEEKIDLRPFVTYAVDNVRQYLNNSFSHEYVQKIIDGEIERNICLDISRKIGVKHHAKLIGNSKAYCEKLLEGIIFRD